MDNQSLNGNTTLLNLTENGTISEFGLRIFTFPWQAAFPLYSIQLLTALMILAVNSLAIYLYFKFDIQRSIQHKFLMQLSFADILSVPVILLSVSLDQPDFLRACIDHRAARFLCYFAAGLIPIYIFSSLLSVMSLTIDRFVQIVWSLRYPTLITEKVFRVMIAFIWIYPVTLGVLVVFNNTWEPYKLCRGVQLTPPVIFAVFGIPTMVIPIMVILFLYIWMLIIAVKRSRHNYIEALPPAIEGPNMENNPMGQLHLKNLKGVKRLGVVIGALMLSFVITMINPYVLPWSTEKDPHLKTIMRVLAEIGNLGLYANSFFNPIIYHFRLPAFRGALRRLRNQQVAPIQSVTEHR